MDTPTEGDTRWSSISPMVANSRSKRHESSGFDGNRTDLLRGWFFPNDKWHGLSPELQEELMEITAAGHLSWVLFPWINPDE